MVCWRDIPEVKSQLTMIANFLGAVQEKLEIVRFSACVEDARQIARQQNWHTLPLHYLTPAVWKTIEEAKNLNRHEPIRYVCFAAIDVASKSELSELQVVANYFLSAHGYWNQFRKYEFERQFDIQHVVIQDY